MQLSLESLTMNDVLKYELTAIPPGMFMDSGDMRIAKSESASKNTIIIAVLS